MSRWIDPIEAAEQLGVSLPMLKKLIRSENPPPYMRPSERSMLFDLDALNAWQAAWEPGKVRERGNKVQA